MKRSRLLLALAILSCAGFGCTRTLNTTKSVTRVPDLRVTWPLNGYATSSARILCSGTTDADHVDIDNIPHLVTNQRFEIPLDLTIGTHTYQFRVSTGYTTTTVSRTITRTEL